MHKEYKQPVPKHLRHIIRNNWGSYYKRHPLTGSEKGVTLEVHCFPSLRSSSGYNYPTALKTKQDLLKLGWICYFEHKQLVKFYKEI